MSGTSQTIPHGAADHLTVPASAPANALAGLPRARFTFDDFELDEVRFEFRASGAVVPMEPQVFDLLRYMVRNPDRVLTKDELLDAIWPERYVTEAALNSRVMSARKALGDDGRQQRHIKTVHGRGYRLVADVQTAEPDHSSTLAARVAEPAAEPGSWTGALRAPSTSFIGRHAEVARIQELLMAEGRPLVSVVGPGGMGKTRLAIAAAGRLHAAGVPVVYVPLEPVCEANELPGAIASALGLRPSTADTAAEVVRHLADARLLLVLDNFEHLAPEGAPFVSRVLAGAPGVQVLVTSRVVLGLVEEWLFRLEGLAPSDAGEAVQLFLERASQANAAAHPPSDEELDAIVEITRLVEGMPLAIELAAALTPYLPYGEIASLLHEGAEVLASDQVNANPRHRSMCALLEESCRQLAPGQLRVLLSLAVFDGPFGAGAAAAVAGAPLLQLRQLVDRSLLQPVEGRFALHPLMRQFARERCGEEIHELRRRHAEYYASFLASRRAALEGRRQVEALRDIESEFANVTAAWRWAARNARIDLLDLGTYPLFCHLTFRARFFEADELGALAIASVAAAGEEGSSLLGGLLMHHFWALSRLGRTRESLETLGRINALFADGREPRPGIGMDPLMAVAAIRVGGGDYAAAAAAAVPALESAQARGDEPAMAFAAWLAGVATLRQARLELIEIGPGAFGYRPAPGAEHQTALDDAARYTHLAGAILEQSGEKWLRGYVEIERGLLAKALGDTPAAIEHFRTACELRRAIGDPQGTASSLIYLADTLLDESHLEECVALHAEASRLFARIGDASGLAEAERFAGRIALYRRDFEAAATHFTRTLEQSAAIGFANNVISALRGLGTILQRTGRPAAAATTHAFVAAHRAPTPFARAGAEFDLAEIGRFHGADLIDRARREAAAMDLGGLSEFAVAALTELPPAPGQSALTPMVKRQNPTLVA